VACGKGTVVDAITVVANRRLVCPEKVVSAMKTVEFSELQ
jgi:hypothetical protein